MHITELDEWQGLTYQLVPERLREQGFDMRLGGLLHAGKYLVLWEPIASARQSTEESLYAVAQYRNQSVQALLREINPRMRKGVPSEAAWRAHGEENGLWLCLWGEIPTNEQHWEMFFRGRPFVTKLRKYDAMWEWGIRGLSWADCPEMPHGSDFLFWPCDVKGNKVRWPTDAEGVML